MTLSDYILCPCTSKTIRRKCFSDCKYICR